jgi:hypothetical protein
MATINKRILEARVTALRKIPGFTVQGDSITGGVTIVDLVNKSTVILPYGNNLHQILKILPNLRAGRHVLPVKKNETIPLF